MTVLNNAYEEISNLIDEERFTEAYEACSDLLSRNSNDPEAMELLAIIIIESGASLTNEDDEGSSSDGAFSLNTALSLLERSIEIAPQSSATKYLYMAQIHGGSEALGYYESALKVLDHQRTVQCSDANQVESINHKMAQVYTAITELYMSDESLALMDGSTEATIKLCQGYLTEALKLDSKSPEAICCQCQFWMSVGGENEAESRGKVVSLLTKFISELVAQVDDPEANEMQLETGDADNNDDDEEEDERENAKEKRQVTQLIDNINYETRLSFVKLLLECQNPSPECLLLLDSLYEENDTPVELDYLTALASFQLSDPAEQVLESLQSFMEKWAQVSSYLDPEEEANQELFQIYSSALELLETVRQSGK